MGYVPPPRPSIALAIIDNISPTLRMLYTIYDSFGSRSEPIGLPRSYEEYMRQVYGRTPGQKYPWWK